MIWQFLGIADLVTAVTLGATAGLINSSRSAHRSYDGVAHELDSDIRGTATDCSSYHLHRAGAAMERRRAGTPRTASTLVGIGSPNDRRQLFQNSNPEELP